ncbi:MAG: mechanosensitive ion channel family protein [candidate division Zixibacteria bacterium]|jgi:small conductance mechanosensitive channel|nr:mechanosensitive ion channel family protein [candidate division Zixibacteria bacterium]
MWIAQVALLPEKVRLDMNIQDLWLTLKDWLLTGGVRVVVILLMMLAAMFITRLVVRRIFSVLASRQSTEEGKKRLVTLRSVVRWATSIVIITVAMMMVLPELGIQIGPILAAAGIVGLAVGFGAQQLVQDVISGFFILMENQIRVGDVVQVAGKSGLVERVTLRMTVLRDTSGSVHYVRNGQIDLVTNMTMDYSYYPIDIGVAYRENTDEVAAVAKGVAEELRNDPAFKDDILEPLEVLGVDKFADSAVIIKARIKTVPIKQWRVGREFNRRLKLAFDARGIEIPFPHVTLYIGAGKKGESAPLRVAMDGGGTVHDSGN